MGLEKRLERIANHYGYPEDLPSSVNEDAAAALSAIRRLGAENDRLKADIHSYEITFGMMHDTAAERDVLAERARQKAVEGYDAAHDDKLGAWELGNAAASYAMWRPFDEDGYLHESLWPWHGEHWKPKDRRSDLVRAGALILSEIERLDRAALSKAEGRSLSSASGQEGGE